VVRRLEFVQVAFELDLSCGKVEVGIQHDLFRRCQGATVLANALVEKVDRFAKNPGSSVFLIIGALAREFAIHLIPELEVEGASTFVVPEDRIKQVVDQIPIALLPAKAGAIGNSGFQSRLGLRRCCWFFLFFDHVFYRGGLYSDGSRWR